MYYTHLIFEEINKLKEDYSVMDMSAVRRYNSGRKFLNRHENVAEHSTHVALNVIRLCGIFNLPDDVKYKAVTWGLLHDISEPVSADLPYEFKIQASDEFSQAFEDFELEQVAKCYPYFAKDFKEFTESGHETIMSRPIERVLVDLADALTVRQYARLEMDIGNTTDEVFKFYELSNERIENHATHMVVLLKQRQLLPTEVIDID